MLRALLVEGMNVARINCSHGTPAEHAETIAAARRAADAEGKTLAVLADLQGPKTRLGEFAHPIDVVAGQRWTLVAAGDADPGDGLLPLPHPEVVRALVPGGRVVFSDGEIEAVVRAVTGDRAEIEIRAGGRLSSRQGVAAPGATPRLAALTAKDHADAAHAVACGVDFVALSFVHSGDDVRALRALLDALPGGREVSVVAKIETRAALEALDGILHTADAVMVARGDLGIEVSPQEVPLHQKDVIRRANLLGIPVITATQMLQSMVDAPRPTRAEASDVANAILDGTDAVMLSAETAIGKYPRQAVAMMREIAAIAETRMPCRAPADDPALALHVHPVSDAISDATVRVAEAAGARLIATATWSGYTARRMARERPRLPIVALTPHEGARRRLALTWGVQSLRIPQFEGTDDMLRVVSQALTASGWVAAGDLVVITGGIPSGGGGTTNFLKVHPIAAPDS